MDPKPTVKDWVESKRSIPPPPIAVDTIVEPHMLGIPKAGDEILGGKYVIERVIGVGGMGVVVAALHKKLGQRVAIKFLAATMQTPELVDRFIREGQAAVRIKSEHIAPVLDVGVLEEGTPYLMMEHLAGADLSEYLTERGNVPIEDAVDFILQACDALAVAHSSGIVHRDLKPSNLFVTQRSDGSPLIKVLDFGISKISATANQPDPKSTLTRPGMMLGSPRYMSPEQLRNASSVDHRADIWAIGVVLHELVAGTPPYDADTFAALCSMIASDPPTRLRDVMPEAPELLESVILKCIEKKVGDRWQNVAELANALAPLASDESRVIASRVSKILGYIPNKTPPGSYGSTKHSPGMPNKATPKPNDRTMPMGDQRVSSFGNQGEPSRDRQMPISSPMASTPIPGALTNPSPNPNPNNSTNPDPPVLSGAPLVSDQNVSALAVSNAKQRARSMTARVGGVLAAVALALGLAFTISFLRRPHTAPDPSQPAAQPSLPTTATTTTTTDPTSAPTTTAHPAAEPTETTAANAGTTTPGIVTTATPQPRINGGGGRILVPRPSASAALTASAPVAPTPTPAQPSEADMLNRRR